MTRIGELAQASADPDSAVTRLLQDKLKLIEARMARIARRVATSAWTRLSIESTSLNHQGSHACPEPH
jgi:hypothetical protein